MTLKQDYQSNRELDLFRNHWGTVSDISKLPPQYQFLEKKSDSLEKVCKRILLVSKTFEVEGYDYPPNLTESISDWWSLNKDGWFGSKKSEKFH